VAFVAFAALRAPSLSVASCPLVSNHGCGLQLRICTEFLVIACATKAVVLNAVVSMRRFSKKRNSRGIRTLGVFVDVFAGKCGVASFFVLRAPDFQCKVHDNNGGLVALLPKKSRLMLNHIAIKGRSSFKKLNVSKLPIRQ
jgi:hypothetical protein